MSNPDSFIDEVTEEVRRDRLFRAFRRYGWIGVVLVAAIVGGAAYNEWQKASRTATAQALGDGLSAALAAGTPEARAAALDGLKVQGAEQAALKALMRASDPAQDREGAIAALRTVEADATLAPVWRDLAALRRVLAEGAAVPVAERRMVLEPLAQPGRPYRPLAAEQLALLLVEEGKTAEAIEALRALMADQEAPSGLRARAGQMIVALGGTVDVSAAPANAG